MGIIRLILALAVVFSHSSPLFGFSFVGGKLAVELFYMISGFYMALVLNEKYNRKKDYKLFITNRMLKLYPIYWIVAILTIIFSVAVIIETDGQDWARLQFYKDYTSQMSLFSFLFLVVSNVILFFQDIIMFLGLNTETGGLFFTSSFWMTNPHLYEFLLVPQAWTISIELMFYLIAPFIARRKLPLILLLTFLSIAIKAGLGYYGYVYDPWSYRFFPSELHLFLMGIITYKIYVSVRLKKISQKKLFLVLIANLILIIFCSQIREVVGILKTDILYILVFFVSIPFIFVLSKKWRFDTKIGELSYPIYISHMFVYFIVMHYDMPVFPDNEGLTICFYTIILSYVLNKLVYDRIDKFRQSRIKHRN